jgi:hypothetical protein
MNAVKRCKEFIVIICPFHSLRSLFSADDKALKLMLESGSAIEDVGKTVRVIERGVRSYD